jgi:hypothetical protein
VKHFLLRHAHGFEGITSTSPLFIYNPKSSACAQHQQSIEYLNRNFVILLLPILLISCVVFEFFTINNVQQFSWLENKCYMKMPKCNILPIVLFNNNSIASMIQKINKFNKSTFLKNKYTSPNNAWARKLLNKLKEKNRKNKYKHQDHKEQICF